MQVVTRWNPRRLYIQVANSCIPSRFFSLHSDTTGGNSTKKKNCSMQTKAQRSNSATGSASSRPVASPRHHTPRSADLDNKFKAAVEFVQQFCDDGSNSSSSSAAGPAAQPSTQNTGKTSIPKNELLQLYGCMMNVQEPHGPGARGVKPPMWDMKGMARFRAWEDEFKRNENDANASKQRYVDIVGGLRPDFYRVIKGSS